MESHTAFILGLLGTLCIVVELTEADIPSNVYLGLETGRIQKCTSDQPDNCATIHESDSSIKTLEIYEEHLYAGLENGHMLRCHMNKDGQCTLFNNAWLVAINGLAVNTNFLYAVLDSGKIWRCPLEKPHSCWDFNDIDTSVKSLALSDDYLYIGLETGQMMSCNFDKTEPCWEIHDAHSTINSLAVSGKYIFAGLDSGEMWRCELERNDSCTVFNTGNSFTYLHVYGDYIYAALQGGEVWRCSLDKPNTCSVFRKYPNNIVSFAMTYRTTELKDTFVGESVSCVWQNTSLCPPLVTYYDIKQRSYFELFVKFGKIVDYRGKLFDTKLADLSHSGRKAIFVMDPTGRVYASNRHPTFMLHTSSFLAGDPVAAAGEIEVEKGVIKRITNCAGHYTPTVSLNEQLIVSLRRKGYESEMHVTDCNGLEMLIDMHYNSLQPNCGCVIENYSILVCVGFLMIFMELRSHL